MILLEPRQYKPLYERYIANRFFYPLIAAVLNNQQAGKVYGNQKHNPSQIYIEHAFGFAQLFGEADRHFESQLENYLFKTPAFTLEKIRFYAPEMPSFLLKTEYASYRSYRQRFILQTNQSLFTHQHQLEGIHFSPVDDQNIASIDSHFKVVSRFWRTPADFIQESKAVVVYYQNEPASICYAAANANAHSEIDVLTLPQHRHLGLGQLAVIQFIKQCIEISQRPLWDCFTNNAGSMMLCKSVGFVAPDAPYLFFTINRAC